MKKAFSLVELLVVCGIMAIVMTVGFNAYSNIREQAETIAQNKDQAVLKQVVETFHLTGGNIKAFDDVTNTHQQAVAMTMLFQGEMPDVDTLAALKHNRTVKGTINEMLPADMMMIPYSASEHPNDGRLRVCLANKKFTLTTDDVDGFIAISKTSTLGVKETAYLSDNPRLLSLAKRDVQKIITNQNLSGNKYADSNAYVWNEDTTAYAGPAGPAPERMTAVTLKTALDINVTLTGTGTYNYWEYDDTTKAVAEIFVFRKDGKPLNSADVTITAKLEGSAKTLSGVALIKSGWRGLMVSVPLKDLRAANTWAEESYTLQVDANPVGSTALIADSDSSTTVAVAPLDLAVSLTPSASELSTGGTIAAAITDEAGNTIGSDIAEFTGVTYNSSLMEFEDGSTVTKAQATFRVK